MLLPYNQRFIIALLGIHMAAAQAIHSSTLLSVPTLIANPTIESGNGVLGDTLVPELGEQADEIMYPYTDSVQEAEATAQVQPIESLPGINNGALLLNPPAPVPTSRVSSFILPTKQPIVSSTVLSSQPPIVSSVIAADNTSIIANVNTLPITPFQLPTAGILTTASGKPIPCSPKSTHLNPTTHKFISECTESTFCLAPPGSLPNATRNGVCAKRRCRRDMYPFGFFGTEGSEMVLNTTTSVATSLKKTKKKHKNPVTKQGPFLPLDLPPICLEGTFCPDDGSGCLPQAPLGGACELARDEQCSMPPNLLVATPLSTGQGKTAKTIPSRPRAICLDRTCMAASQSLSEPCILENATYVSDIDKGQAGAGLFTSHIIRDNCLSPTYYCSLEGVTAPLIKAKLAPPIGGFAFSSGKYKLMEDGVFIGKGTCKRSKLLGEQCLWDAMCETHNCDPTLGTCVLPPQTPIHIAPWQWLLTSFCIFAAIIVTCVLLSVIHRRNQEEEYRELVEYYEEQSGLRRSLTALYAAAGYFHVDRDITVNTVDSKPYEKSRRGSLYYRD